MGNNVSKADLRSIEFITDIFKYINEKVIVCINLIESIYLGNIELNKAVIKKLKKTEPDYYTLDLYRHFTSEISNENVALILEVALNETRERAKLFFLNLEVDEWDIAINKYKLYFIKCNLETDYLIGYLDKLYFSLFLVENSFLIAQNKVKLIYSDKFDCVAIQFNKADDFYFRDTMQKASKENNLQIKKQIFIDEIARCKLFCLNNDDFFLDEKIEEYNKRFENYKEYIVKCENAIDIINFQLQHTQTIASQHVSSEDIEINKIPEAKPVTLNDYFIDNVNIETINKIQSTFSSFEGKRLAIVIYLLQSEFKLLKPQSQKLRPRIKFVNLLKNDDNIKQITYINRLLVNQNDILEVSKTDVEYIEIHQKLAELLK